MDGKTDVDRDSHPITRRRFLEAAAGAVAAGALTPAEDAVAAPAVADASGTPAAELARLTDKLEYLTPMDRFGGFVREKPAPFKLPAEKMRQVGLVRETWRLEVVPEKGGNAKVDHPLSLRAGTALDFPGLMKLAEKHAVRFIATSTCTNFDEPFGTALWEGVPLRQVVWLARPRANVRRVYYDGFHNNDPRQRFISSLTMARVLEDPPGELPVILCYKMNGRWLSCKQGGPVRMIVPGAYGNKSVKWLRQVVLSNSYQANDTYAGWNNDTESPMKSVARFIRPPRKAKARRPLPLVGMAQVGMGGLSKVQLAFAPHDSPAGADDPYLTKLPWRDARILPPPSDWGGDLPGGKLPDVPLQFDPATGRPRSWPMRYAIVHWSALPVAPAAGRYRLCCRAIDGNGIAQPMPRPLPKSGRNAIQKLPLLVEA
jgi:DMSO/TMAO reductase YedYZ molybdopterin-dependent catalytic subunit